MRASDGPRLSCARIAIAECNSLIRFKNLLLICGPDRTSLPDEIPQFVGQLQIKTFISEEPSSEPALNFMKAEMLEADWASATE